MSEPSILELFDKEEKQQLNLGEIRSRLSLITQDANQAVHSVEALQQELGRIQETNKLAELEKIEEAMLVLKRTGSNFEKILDLLTDMWFYFEKASKNAVLEREVLTLLKDRLA
jgi:hypothetical protein